MGRKRTFGEMSEDINCSDATDIVAIESEGRSLEIKGIFCIPINIHDTLKVMKKFKYASYSKNSILCCYNAHIHIYLESRRFYLFFSYDSILNRDFQFCAHVAMRLIQSVHVIRKHPEKEELPDFLRLPYESSSPCSSWTYNCGC